MMLVGTGTVRTVGKVLWFYYFSIHIEWKRKRKRKTISWCRLKMEYWTFLIKPIIHYFRSLHQQNYKMLKRRHKLFLRWNLFIQRFSFSQTKFNNAAGRFNGKFKQIIRSIIFYFIIWYSKVCLSLNKNKSLGKSICEAERCFWQIHGWVGNWPCHSFVYFPG